MKAEWPISDWSIFLKSVPSGSHTTHASTRVFTATWSILPKKLLIFSLIFDFIKNGILGLISWLYNPLMGLPLIGHEWNLKKNKVQQDTVHWLFFDQKKKKTWNILFRKTRDSLSYPTGIGKVWSSNSGNHFKNPRALKHQGHKTLAEKGCPHLLRPGSGSSPPSHPGTAFSGLSPVTPARPLWRPQPRPWRSLPPTTNNTSSIL